MVLTAEKIVKVYKGKDKANDTNALNGIDLSIEKGEFVGLMGPSGSGKTTLLNLLSGIDQVTSGNICISGKDINIMSKDELASFRRMSLGYVFQEFNLLDSLTLKENIMLPMILDNKLSADIEKKVAEVASEFDITDILNKYPYAVSGGQQQRAAISRAIINDPEIIFADEPTGNLDSKASKAVMKCFEKLNLAREITILVVTHDPFTASYCNRVVFIKDGLFNMEIRKNGSRSEFFQNILDSLAVIGGDQDDF